MQFVTLTLRDTQLPVIVNLANVDYIQSAGGNGSNLHFSRETIYVVESPAEIEALVQGAAAPSYFVPNDGAPVIQGTPEGAAAAIAEITAALNTIDEPPAKPGSKRETK